MCSFCELAADNAWLSATRASHSLLQNGGPARAHHVWTTSAPCETGAINHRLLNSNRDVRVINCALFVSVNHFELPYSHVDDRPVAVDSDWGWAANKTRYPCTSIVSSYNNCLQASCKWSGTLTSEVEWRSARTRAESSQRSGQVCIKNLKSFTNIVGLPYLLLHYCAIYFVSS